MSDDYTKGIAFIMEGATEKVFYRSFLQWLADNNEGCSFDKIDNLDIGEIAFEWKFGKESVLIKFNVVGTVTQIIHSGKWFANTCAKKYKIPWQVFLCYDTDSPDIEDVMLVDLEGICKYVGISMPTELKGRKGKAKMKALYRSCGNTYHEGEKTADMVKKLDFQKIIDEGPIDLHRLENEIKHNM